MTLQRTLSGLLAKAAQTGETQTWQLGKGLRVRVSATPNRLCLWRDQGEWKPGEAAEREGHTCAEKLGWTDHLLHWHGKYLVVTQVAPLLEGTS